MAVMAACKRVGQFGPNSYSWMIGGGVSRFEGLVVSPTIPPSAIRLLASPTLFSQWRHCSQLVKSNGKRLFLIDTLALVRRLEAEGLPSKQAEAITAAMTEVLNDSLENVSLSVVSKFEMQKELHFSVPQHENEKLRNDIEKMRSELRHEIDKVTAGQRLDLNLERGRIRDELSNQSAGTSNLTNKLDREIHALKAHLEAAKYDLIKYCIGTLVSISAVGLAVVRVLL
ncbi:hypothetical protein CXB51_027969 [Gossypium anomalum]|uniref:DUF1640 domain-containing protein n=1 Tax=Gossypium anomalum TaxID=47600 RepID=A0A8J5Y5T9_9ROSI|nr:hypothetical protein CXB51_027969 [Gossypium anomalum]